MRTPAVHYGDEAAFKPAAGAVKARNRPCQVGGHPHTPQQEMRMRKFWLVLAAPLAIVATACGKQDSKALDAALKNDLALASQAQPYNPQQIVSPTEQGLAAQVYAPQNFQAVARQPVAAQPVRRTSTVRRSSGSGASRSSGSGGYYPSAPAQERVEKHTGRDAAIGAGA